MNNWTIFFLVLFSNLAFSLQAQTYEIGSVNGQTITTCSGLFSDSNTNGDYDDNANYTVTFCASNPTDYLKFIFNPDETDSSFNDGNFDLLAGDTLYVYDGVGTSGTLITQIDGSDDPLGSHFLLISQSNCITFHFVSNASGNSDGWRAEISCIPTNCGNNPMAADDFADAPYICNLDGFCGTTSGYTEDNPFNMTGGGNCPTLFGGTLENNSWLQFEASATSIDLELTVPVCYDAFGTTTDFINNGIQAAILEFDGSMFTRVSDCSFSDGSQTTFTLSSTTLVIGNTYYIMVDGEAGARCDYYIETITPSIAVVDAGADQTFCAGDMVTLTASGPSSAIYTWTGSDGSGPFTGMSIVVTPTTTMTYMLEVTRGFCLNETDTVTVTADTNCCTADEYYTNIVSPNTYQTSNTIGSNGTVETNTTVNFLSNCILMEAPFEVELGADFLADIDPCN